MARNGEEVVSIKDLIRAGLIQGGETLVWRRKVQGTIHEARLLDDGVIQTDDGKRHKTPSGAARHFNNEKPVDGWIAWRVKSTGELLSSLREKLSN